MDVSQEESGGYPPLRLAADRGEEVFEPYEPPSLIDQGAREPVPIRPGIEGTSPQITPF